jgi:hypothetical protein
MQRRHATSGQGRPQWRRLAAKRFFNSRNGGLLRSGGDGWFDTTGNAGYNGFRGGWRMLGHALRPRVLLHLFRFGNCHGTVGFPARRIASPALQAFPDNQRDRFVNGAGMGFLLRDTELGQHVDNGVRWDFELPCQLVDADFRHR